MDISAARRYARALHEAAKSQQSVVEVGEDLQAISQILEAKSQFKEILNSPEVDRNRKLDLVDKVFADRARPLTMRLLRLLIEKNRQRELPAVQNEFVRLQEEAAGILRVTITSAIPLQQNQVDEIIERVSRQTGKRVIPKMHVDPSLIGGVMVQYGNSILDGSVSGALNRLKERLYIDVLKQA